jgi:hypothetical protein
MASLYNKFLSRTVPVDDPERFSLLLQALGFDVHDDEFDGKVIICDWASPPVLPGRRASKARLTLSEVASTFARPPFDQLIGFRRHIETTLVPQRAADLNDPRFAAAFGEQAANE